MAGIVYLIECLVSRKNYVGITRTGMKVRWQSHVSLARRRPSSGLLCRAIAKYGPDSFKLSILEECPGGLDELNAAEVGWIAKLGTKTPGGYNITIGGDGTKGAPKSEEWKRKASERRKGYKFSDEVKARMSLARTGKKLSLAHRATLSKVRRGRKVSDLTREKIGAAHRGKKISQETIEKLRQMRLGFSCITEEGRRTLSRPVMADGREYGGIHEAAEAIGVRVSTIDRRIRDGIPGYCSLKPKASRPKKSTAEIEQMRARSSKSVMAEGVIYPSMTEAAKALGMTRPGVAYRIRVGHPQYSMGQA